MDDFENYIEINNLNMKDFYVVMEKYLLNEIMGCVYLNLENNNNRIELKKKLLQCNNNTSRSIILKNYIETIIKNVKLTSKQQEYLNKATYSYMRKSSLRENKIHLRNEILPKQGYKCNICNKKLENNNFELDHDLPFKFVGDKLDDNNQVLCKECNRKKGTKYYYVIKKFLLK